MKFLNQMTIVVISHLIKKFHQLHSYGILGVRIFENSILSTADLGGYIKFHQINEGTNETNAINVSIILKHEERAYQRPDGYGFTHLDNDGDKLVSGSGKGEVVAWDFRSNKKLYMVDSQQVCKDYFFMSKHTTFKFKFFP